MPRSNYISISKWIVIIIFILNLYWSWDILHTDRCRSRSAESGNSQMKTPSSKLNIIKAPQIVLESSFIPLKMRTISWHMQSTIAFSDINFNLGRWDQERFYKFYDFALVGDTFAGASDHSVVCLATQSSVERLHSLAQVGRQWRGPISVAVFVAGNEEFLILQYYVTYMRMCLNYLRDNVTFHVAVPFTKQPDQTMHMLGGLASKFDCQYPEQTLRRLLRLRSSETMRWRLRNEYPQNHMRNLARKGCQNKYVFLTDMDIVPSANIVPQLNIFLNSIECKGRCAYVIPTFEIDVRVKFPDSKTELLRLFKKNLARPFHEKVFIYNQYATNFSRWMKNIDSDSLIHISHEVTNFEFLYEPFYVALDNVPLHDERFVGYGFTRNSQVYEMYVAGYTFYVLSPVFTCHWGLQQKKMRPVWREQQNNVNRKRFETFKSEIFSRYKNNPHVKSNVNIIKRK